MLSYAVRLVKLNGLTKFRNPTYSGFEKLFVLDMIMLIFRLPCKQHNV